MNLSQLRKLKDGDKIICRHLPAFADGKTYTVRKTFIGRIVTDDKGVGRYLSRIVHLFEKVDGEEKESG